ncbi:1685_t:CDS:2 [Cetraspora pellucida]|uniref:1685_t:CDS:1 n=1 Tax=Cetraspora pellucida TaxID=1433469 RepID=A0ACA9KKI6_9GLOM|nr:1685_t:CDS:2 [Cetraspora pellucida]
MPAPHNYPHHIRHQENLRIFKSLKRTPKIRPAKSCQKKPTEVLESDSILELTNDYLEGLKIWSLKTKFALNERNKLGHCLGIEVDKAEQDSSKQVKVGDGLEDELENLINDYLETLKT